MTDDLARYLPHRPPMILLHRLLSVDDSHACCEVWIEPGIPFFDPALDGVPAYVGTEYMAQTIALFAGARALSRGERVKVGFLLGTRRYQPAVTHFARGSRLRVYGSPLHEEESGLCLFDCRIEAGDSLLVQARMNVFQPEDPEAFLAEQA